MSIAEAKFSNITVILSFSVHRFAEDIYPSFRARKPKNKTADI